MFERRGSIIPYTQEQTFHWLSWLATVMDQHKQSVFYLEWLQPDYLSEPGQQQMVTSGAGALCGLIFSLFFDLVRNPSSVGTFVLRAIMFTAIGLFFGSARDTIRPAEKLEGLSAGAFLGLIMGMFCVLIWLIDLLATHWVGFHLFQRFGPPHQFHGVVVLTVGVLRAIFITIITLSYILMVFGLYNVVRKGEISTRLAPNEGMRCSLRSALFMGLVSGLLLSPPIVLLDPNDSWPGEWPEYALEIGFIFGLGKGGFAYFQHFILRFLLWHNNDAPFRYIRFLDFAAERILLRKVGGGYIFVHRMLLEYFAKRDAHQSLTIQT